ncbi:MAG: S24/S26 family peptidase [Deltaproteobacteria bacterium]|nr:S24/S26 family peptidase [Deltaproteobacteria bacterium]
MRVLANSALFVDVVQEILARQFAVRFRAAGHSMRPAILDGDLVVIEPLSGAAPGPGSVVLARAGGRLLLHRVVDVRKVRGRTRVVLQGDASASPDPLLESSQILALLTRVARRGRLGALLRRLAA